MSSAKIESKSDSHRSHLSSFTTKLKVKFHSPKTKRSPSQKIAKPQTDHGEKTPEKLVKKNLSHLEEQEKEVVSTLHYFKIIADKMVVDQKVLEMLPGSASKVLEAVLPLVHVDSKMQQSSAVTSSQSRVYQSLANLIRWSDTVMINSVTLEDKESVTSVKTLIKAVLDSVKDLVKLLMEKKEHPSPVSATPPIPKSGRVNAEACLYETKKETLTTSTENQSKTKHVEVLTDKADEEMAPPKPPLPTLQLPEDSPPILPPKQRHSVSSPTKIVVLPINRDFTGCSLPLTFNKQRRFSSGSRSLCGDSPHLSPSSSLGKLSHSAEHLSSLDLDSGRWSRNTSSETVDCIENNDPDYDFLHQDLSSEDHPFGIHIGGGLSPLPEFCNDSSPLGHGQLAQPWTCSPSSTFSSQCPPERCRSLVPEGPDTKPPALPEKKRRSTPGPITSPSDSHAAYVRHKSQYDNVPETDVQLMISCPGIMSPSSDSSPFTSSVSGSPPPLPEKRNRHIQAYMQFVEDYSEPQPSVFYRTPLSDNIYEQRNKRLQEAYGFSDSICSSDSVLELHSAPTLPPKQKQLDPSQTMDDALQDPTAQNVPSGSKEASDMQRKRPSTDSGQSEEEVDELCLEDHEEILSRIMLKKENDDGPDVRAGSADILLVHATETDHKDIVLFCEAFLSTYRTFITPEDLIKKLHYRYSTFCHSSDTFKRRISKNTFFVLVRVVDELCPMELTDDILKHLMDLVFQLVCYGELSLARVLRKNILEKMQQKKQLRYSSLFKPLSARGVAARPGTLHDFRSHEIAEQLTLLDAELFYKIEIPEVLLWAKEQNEEKSPNLTEFTEHFNNMSYWVRSLIILQEKAQDRERLVLKFIKIMKHLRKLNNFNSYLAILSALDSAPIRRLEWQKQTSEGLEEYCMLIDSSSSFRTYRAALADVEAPCIPYLGLILQDLTFVHLGNPDFVDRKVNFSKRWQQFNILDSMRRFQQVHYEIDRDDDIISFFNDFSDHLAEEALWELSLKIKPRNVTRCRVEAEDNA
ncbi:rap guanine nucleotide exchange factor 1-like isoform X2 [Scleropages formosus]|uniref:rap guanine nucleotide exchange factor 1-like isoform X2 n=1 Tax=Scleropages formosus TaxID=113540 RepID=UPI0008790D69|nr:rap guanine nucleotide exchange factor 1-like isoform X2 [Scleropages formosus]